MRWVFRTVIVLICGAVASPGVSQTIWADGAEQGTDQVIDGTDASYLLVQSDVVGNGDYAFHLANPDFQDNWFEIAQSITPLSNTKLFFLSRLSWATDTQVAKVQLSTDGGASWPVDLYSQAGDGGPGEGAFSRREVDLSSYESQPLRVRFMYDYDDVADEPAFTDTNNDVGWLVDDIQFGDRFDKALFSVGNPSPHEQLYLEYINRARTDALVETERLASETDSDITSAYDAFNIDPQNIVDQFAWSIDTGHLDRHAQPLSFHKKLLLASQLHSEDMLENDFQGHDSSSNPPAPLVPGGGLGARLDAVGYHGGGAENVFAFAESVRSGHAAFDVDWGDADNENSEWFNPAFVGQGMQNPAGHRANIHNDSFKEVGIGVVHGSNGSVGPQIVTQDFGQPGNTTYVTGVVYEDLDGDEFYDVGEGRSGVRVDVEGAAHYAISSDSGAYSVPVVGDGTYTVDFTGGGWAKFSTTADIVDGRNFKIDYLVTPGASLLADYNGDAVVDQADYELWKSTYGSTTDLRADGNGDQAVNLADYSLWRDALDNASIASPELAVAVPEPSSLVAVVNAAALLLIRRKRRLG